MFKRFVIIQTERGRYCLIDRLAGTHSEHYSNTVSECLSTTMSSWAINIPNGLVDLVVRNRSSIDYSVIYTGDIYPSIETTPELFV